MRLRTRNICMELIDTEEKLQTAKVKLAVERMPPGLFGAKP
jgi:hypothetical protein